MSIRVDASGDSLSRTTNLPSTSTFTMMLWFYVVTFRGQNNFFGGDNTWFLYTSTTQKHLNFYVTEENVGSTTLSVNTWYHAAITRDGTNYRWYINGSLEGTKANTTAAGSKLWCGNDAFGDYHDGRMAAIKLYSGLAMNGAQIANEMLTYRPNTFASLNSWYPCFPGSTERARDYSGNGYNWTQNGTLTDEDMPPITWGGATPYIKSASAAAGPVIPVFMDQYRQRVA